MADNYALRKIFDGVTTDQLHAVISTSLGHGCNITGEFGSNNTGLQVLDYQKLREKEAVDIDTNPASTSIALEGKDYQEVNSSVSNAFGFSAGKGESFDNSLSISTGNMMKNSNTYEYGIRLMMNKILGARLTITSQEVLKSYILPDVLCHINGKPDSNNQVPYPSDETKLKQLFRDYGTHIITKAIFGCKFEYYLIREISDWESSITEQVNFALNSRFSSSSDRKALGIGGNTDNSSANSQTCENCNVQTRERRVGGNTSSPDIDGWQYSCTFDMPQTLAMIGYNYNFSDNKEDSGLVPLWEFVDDPARKQKMKEIYEVYVQENLIPIITPKRVIIDVIGKHFGKNEKASETMVMTDYTGKTRKYKRLNEEIMRHVKGSTKGSFYYYYATDFSTNGGITAVKFDNENTGKWNKSEKDSSWAWQKRGNHSNEGVTGCLDNINVYVRPVNRNDYPSDEAYEKDLVSGFGIEVEKSKKLYENAASNQEWTRQGKKWYSGGLCSDDVYCISTKDVAK